VIEINVIAGMGHGKPLGGDGLGNPGAVHALSRHLADAGDRAVLGHSAAAG
jgi:hypothetical protein